MGGRRLARPGELAPFRCAHNGHVDLLGYQGSDQVVHLLALVGSVLDDITATGQVETVTFVKGQLDGEEIDGVLIEIRDDEDRISEVTLLLRPLTLLQTATRRMARALAEGGQPDG